MLKFKESILLIFCYFVIFFQEEVKNEINIMNQLNHVNLIQLYDAFEAKNNITLIME